MDRLPRVAPEKKIAIEVDNVEEAREAVDAGFDMLQLERFSLAAVGEVAAHARLRAIPPLIAAAGGVTVANAADYVRAGAGMIVTSAPFWAPPADVNVSIAEVRMKWLSQSVHPRFPRLPAGPGHAEASARQAHRPGVSQEPAKARPTPFAHDQALAASPRPAASRRRDPTSRRRTPCRASPDRRPTSGRRAWRCSCR